MNMEMERKAIVNSKDDIKDGGASNGDGGDGGGGLSILTTSLFLFGELAGIGILALPHAIEHTGYIGVLLIVVACLSSCFTGHLLDKSWTMVQSQYPEHQGRHRHPYPTIAFIAYGKTGRFLISMCSNLTVFGAVVIALIVSSQNINRLLVDIFDIDISFCAIQLVVVALLLPFTWFGTPKDFWGIGLGAALSTTIAMTLALVMIVKDSYNVKQLSHVQHSYVEAVSFFESVGAIIFSTGGHFAFLTFQNDMKNPSNFACSLSISYTVLCLVYIPVSLMGFLVYGKSIQSNLLLSLSPGPISYAILILMTCHQFCAFVIMFNPLLQHLESFLNFTTSFSWRRVTIRTIMVLLALFVAESVPNFGSVVSLLGGSCNMAIMYLGPPLIYLKLCGLEGNWPVSHVPLHVKALCLEIVAVGFLIGVMSTYGSVRSLWGTNSFTVPCYIDAEAASHGG